MSDMSDGIGAALSALNTLEDPGTIEYRATIGTGAWTTLSGAIFHRQGSDLVFNEDRSREQEDEEASMTVPIGQDLLAEDYEVRVGEDDSDLWHVTAGPVGTNQKQYDLMRVTPKKAGLNRRNI